MHSTRTSSIRHLPKDQRERRVREAAALPGADEAGGQAAYFLPDIKVAYDEPLTRDQHPTRRYREHLRRAGNTKNPVNTGERTPGGETTEPKVGSSNLSGRVWTLVELEATSTLIDQLPRLADAELAFVRIDARKRDQDVWLRPDGGEHVAVAKARADT
jgi:hypothetical protein